MLIRLISVNTRFIFFAPIFENAKRQNCSVRRYEHGDIKYENFGRRTEKLRGDEVC